MKTIENHIWINEDIDIVYDITNDINNWKNLFTEYAESEVLSQYDNTILFKLTTVPDQDGKQWSWESERILDKENYICIAQRKNPLFPFDSMVIKWKYRRLNFGTLMTWKQVFSVNKNAACTEEEFQKYLDLGTKEQMAIIKEKIESGKYRKDDK